MHSNKSRTNVGYIYNGEPRPIKMPFYYFSTTINGVDVNLSRSSGNFLTLRGNSPKSSEH